MLESKAFSIVPLQRSLLLSERKRRERHRSTALPASELHDAPVQARVQVQGLECGRHVLQPTGYLWVPLSLWWRRIRKSRKEKRRVFGEHQG